METIFLLDSQEEFETTVQEVVKKYYNWNNWQETPKYSASIIAAKEELKQLLLDSKFNINQVSESLAHKGWDKAKIAFFIKLLNDNKTELLYASLLNQNSEYGETITNFECILKLILGTSEQNTVKYPLLQLVLFSENNGIYNKCSYDIKKDVLLKLINTLETLNENT